MAAVDRMEPRPRARRALVIVHSYYVRDTRPRRHAAALAAAGWEVEVLCAREAGEARRESVGGVRVRRLPARRRRGSKVRYVFEYVTFAALALAAVTASSLRRRYDVVYVIGIPNFIVFSALLPRLLGSRVLLDMRDPLPEFYQAKFSLSERHPLIRTLRLEERLSARFASGVLTVVPSMAELYARSVPRERISIVMNAPDPAMFGDRDAVTRRDPSDRTMLYSGTVAPRYGVDLAVTALARARDRVPGLRLRVVGDGDLVPGIRRLARALGVEDAVSIEEPVPLDRVPEIVRSAWIGVQPNRDDPLMRHSLSTKVLEWCRLGLPVAAGRTQPLVELFAADELMFHDPGDAEGLAARILEAHEDAAALAGRAERAAKAAARVRYDEQIEALLRAFEGREPRV